MGAPASPSYSLRDVSVWVYYNPGGFTIPQHGCVPGSSSNGTGGSCATPTPNYVFKVQTDKNCWVGDAVVTGAGATVTLMPDAVPFQSGQDREVYFHGGNLWASGDFVTISLVIYAPNPSNFTRPQAPTTLTFQSVEVLGTTNGTIH